jgi:glucan phosphoethanolaminetransferase (alkaline phosphatase superfamily)
MTWLREEFWERFGLRHTFVLFVLYGGCFFLMLIAWFLIRYFNKLQKGQKEKLSVLQRIGIILLIVMAFSLPVIASGVFIPILLKTIEMFYFSISYLVLIFGYLLLCQKENNSQFQKTK